MCAQVILLTGPSGSGKTSLLRRVGAHRLRLDDFYRDGDEPDTDLQSDEEAQMPPVRTDLRHPARADRPGRRQRQRQAAQRHHCGRDERGDNGLAKPEHGQTPAPGPGGDHGAGRDDQGQVEAVPSGAVGSKPSSGMAGTGPVTTESGENRVPAPTAKPGPASHASAHTSMVGAQQACSAMSPRDARIPPADSAS